MPAANDASVAYSASYAAGIKHSIQHIYSAQPMLSRATIAGTLAVFAHHFIFRRGEWHLKAPWILIAYLVSPPLLIFTELVAFDNLSIFGAIFNAFTILSCFTVVFFISITTYRIFFHDLRSFPGPRGAAVSKIWHAVKCRDSKNYLVLDGLREEYGDFVRTGPNEITIFHPEALRKLDGPGSKTTKSVWYDFLMPDMGVTTLRDKRFHDQRRKIWTQAFSSKAVPHYERQMRNHAVKLKEIIEESEGTPVSFSSLSYWFSFDVMGMFALSESFDMLHDEQWHYAVNNLRRAMSLLGPLSPVPWLAQIGFKFLKNYWVVKDWHSMMSWCRSRMENKVKTNSKDTDVLSFLIADSEKRNSISADHHLLSGEAIVAIVAGSDTVAPTIIFLFYELAKNPDMAEQLFQELKGVDLEDHSALEKLPLLNAMINETMRLHPAVPTGGNRDTPPEGMTINGRFIPANTTIVAPRYSIFRSNLCYERPNEFIPERWYDDSKLIMDASSFLPFAQGRYTCLGKLLALSEIRTVTSLLVSNFKMNFPQGDDGSQVERDFRDQFTASPGKLNLVFTRRI